jgi:hypothetical protein
MLIVKKAVSPFGRPLLPLFNFFIYLNPIMLMAHQRSPESKCGSFLSRKEKQQQSKINMEASRSFIINWAIG